MFILKSYWPKIMKDGDYVRNFDEYKLRDNHWIAMSVNGNSVTDFNSFAIEHNLLAQCQQ